MATNLELSIHTIKLYVHLFVQANLNKDESLQVCLFNTILIKSRLNIAAIRFSHG